MTRFSTNGLVRIATAFYLLFLGCTGTPGVGDEGDVGNQDAPAVDADTVPDSVPEADATEELPTEPYYEDSDQTEVNRQTTDGRTWLETTSGVLANPHFTLRVCDSHFPAGSAAFAEVEAAVALFNAVEGADLSIEIAHWPHVEVSEMYADHEEPVFHFDYVLDGFPCHSEYSAREDSLNPQSWAMNTCRYSGEGRWAGGASFWSFNVAVNAARREHDDDPTNTDHPRAENIAHEIGHGFGMGHTPNWPEEFRGLISTMQGNQPTLSAYDHGYLRGLYPFEEVSVVPATLVPSPQVRDSDGEGGFVRTFFSSVDNPNTDRFASNPTDLYLHEGGTVMDCSTHQDPIFLAGWYNIGTEEAAEFQCQLTLRSEDEEWVVYRWAAVSLPGEAQDHWIQQVVLPNQPSDYFVDRETSLLLRLDSGAVNGAPVEFAAPISVHREPAGCP